MPSINQFAHYLSGPFDESISNKSDVFQLGGPIITIHVTKVNPTDAGIVTLQATNVEPVDGASDTYMDWQSITTCDVASGPKSVPTYYAFGRLVYGGKGKVGCTYSDSREADPGGAAGGGTNIDFGIAGQQVAEANTAGQIRQILQLSNTATLTAGSVGSQIIQSDTEAQVKSVLNIGTVAALNRGDLGEQLVQMSNVNELKTLLSLGSAAYLTAGVTGQTILQAQDAQGVKNTLGLSSLASTTPSAIGHNIVTALDEANVRSLLSLGTASLVNHGVIGKSILEKNDESEIKNLLNLNFGNTSTTYARGDHSHSDYMPISGGSFTGSVGTNIVPSQATDLVNKQYVDTLLSGFKYKEPVKVATTALISLSGLQVIDGVSLVAGNRVLVKNQTTQEHNGIWVVSSGTWTRAVDFDTWSEIPGAMVVVESGTTYADTGWICTSNSGGTLNSTPITFVQNFTAAGTFVQGTGISIAGNVISLSQDTTLRTGLNADMVDGYHVGGLTAGTVGAYIPVVSSIGILEAGRVIDMHRNGSTTDYDVRLSISDTDYYLYRNSNKIWDDGSVSTAIKKLGNIVPATGSVAFYPDATNDAQLYTTSAWIRNSFSNSADAAAAKTALGLSTVATSASASDLTTGTIANDRLPGRLKAYGTSVTDANLAVETGGPYYLASTGLNNPTGGSYSVSIMVISLSANYIEQVATAYNIDSATDSKKWWRDYTNGTWSAWTIVAANKAEQALYWAPISHTHSYLPLTGGTLTGALTLSGDPTAALHSATKQYVDAKMTYAQPSYVVRAASTANNVRSGLITMDDVALNAGDLVLIRTAANSADNGIYVVSSGTWTRATDADTWDKLASKPVTVLEGTISGGSTYTNNARAGSGTLGTTNIIYTMVGKKYTDDAIKLLYIRRPVIVATTTNITLSGGQTIDGIVLNTGDRVLVKNQTNATQNGIYTVSLITAWSRAEDCSTWDTLVGIGIYVAAGTVNAGTTWHNTNYGSGTLGTTNITFTSDNVILTSSDITTALGYTPTTQSYVDTEFLDSSNKQMCHCATTANITLSGIQTIDGQATAAGQRVLVKDQTNAGENGIYVVASGAWTRATDANTLDRLVGASVSVARGTINGMSTFVSNTTVSGGTLGVTAVTFKAAIPTKVSELGLTEAYFDVKLGYGTGAGGSVTQATSKSTAVYIHKLCGTIIMSNAALAAGATVSFTLNNTYITSGSFVIVHHYFAGTLGAYRVDTHATTDGSVVIRVKNESASSLSEAIQLRFMVMHGTAS